MLVVTESRIPAVGESRGERQPVVVVVQVVAVAVAARKVIEIRRTGTARLGSRAARSINAHLLHKI